MDRRNWVGQEGSEAYWTALAQSKPLSRKQELDLAVRVQAGDRVARDTLVQANLRFVVRIARQYRHSSLSLAELVAAGNLGLLNAAGRFDPGYACKFISYAVWWIRQAMQQALLEEGRTVRLPAHRVELLRGIAHTKRRLEQDGVAEVDLEKVADDLAVSAATVEDTLSSAQAVLSLETPVDEGHVLMDYLADDDQEAPDEEVVRQSDQAHWERLLARLDQREQRVLRLYYGLGEDGPLTLQEIGALMYMTRERVRQIKERALKKLQYIVQGATDR